MEDFENKPDEQKGSTEQSSEAMLVEEGTQTGAVMGKGEDGEKELFDWYAGELIEIDNNGTKWKVDPKTKERIKVVEYGDLSED